MVPSSSGSHSPEKRNALALTMKPQQSLKTSELHVQQQSVTPQQSSIFNITNVRPSQLTSSK